MAKVQCVHNTDYTEENKIETYMHCAKCAEEWQNLPEPKKAPGDYQRISVGFTDRGQLQVWCMRHDCNVDHMTFSVKPERKHG